MNTPNEPNNPRAFPVVNYEWGHIQKGMTLRDYFAGQVLSGAIEMITKEAAAKRSSTEETITIIAGFCYNIADAMLKGREEV